VVFSGHRPLSTEEVGAVILRKVWEKKPMEVAIPRRRGCIGLLMGLDPRLGLWGAKRMEQKGRDKLQRIRAGQDGENC
jgi:3-oxoacyl-[acyl-carrier protein] reductase